MFTPFLQFGHESVTALKKLADKWLLSSSIFGEECELVNALLYTTLAVPDGFTVLPPKDVVYTFLERCGYYVLFLVGLAMFTIMLNHLMFLVVCLRCGLLLIYSALLQI